MSISLSQPSPRTAIGEAARVPAGAGVTTWFSAGTDTIKLASQLADGSLGLIEASVPPGGGPVAHTHAHEDEIWYLIPSIPEGRGDGSTGGDGERTRDAITVG
jgi:mannose-6-phosphate isomerase-like protein (cupin superfamily)